jgi:hypothetical protein
MNRNSFFDLLPNGTEVFVANEKDYWGDLVFERLSTNERLYYRERKAVIVEQSRGSIRREYGYIVQFEDGSTLPVHCTDVRLPDETYEYDDGRRIDAHQLRRLTSQERLDGMKDAAQRPEPKLHYIYPEPRTPGQIARFGDK